MIMEKMLKLYTYVDGANDTPFPSVDEQVIIGSFTYTANRMGGAPQFSATVKHRLCLDDLWNDKVYAEFNGEKYFVINTPSSSKSNDDTRYKHDLELLSEREILNHVYFIDAVQGDSDTDVYKSNSTKVLFYGDIRQFVARLNASLSYRNLGYTAVIDDGITSEDKQVSFEDKYILEALQEEFNIFEIPYYFVGKVIHFGYTSNAITTTFKYGHDDAFLSISKDNANYALINRITGVGSSDNIPYYYPNETDDQSAVEASGKKWITPSQNLMPSIYRESEGAEMFYEAKNNTYPDGEGGYYQFENEYSGTNPREGKTNFEDIKPTITGITNAAGQRIDMFVEFAYDTNDNDDVDEEGNYLHPYFFAKLRKTDGAYGFNLFDHAIESQTMQITFTSGICGACTFEIAVGEDTQKNLVQVGETSGALMRDEDGNVLCGREDLQQPQTPQDRQNDTKNYEVWIALRKDNSTYPQVMPNVNYNYKPSTSDTFAILGISLPQAYILKAEDELEKSLVKHMWMNNVEKFTFSAKFSRIFFTEHPEVLAQLNENARVIIEYNGKQHTLYIDNYSYKMDASSPLPEIDVDLVDTLSVGQNSLQTQLDSVKQDILSSMGGGDFLKTGLKYFLRKDTSDTARGKITFVRGIDVGTFAENTSGGTFRVLEDLTTYAEVDKLRVRVKAYFETLEIINTNSVGGKMILTAGGGVYLRDVKDRETLEDGTEQVWDFYRCYFLTEQDGREVENRFHVGDLAMSQSFNIKAGTHQGVTNHYYWREVVGIGDDYIDLSKTICDTGSDAPMAEDTVCHLGNRSDKDRQGAIIFSAVDVFSPSITLYYGINDFSLVNKDYVSYGVDNSTGNAFFRVYGEMYAGDREQTSYVKYTPGFGVEMRGTFLNSAGSNIEDIINALQNSVDGNIETWFGEEEPTLSNEPAVNWTTDEDKNIHLGDLYYSDAGVAYRFQMEGANYVWKMLKDSDITKALADAKAAKDAADAAQDAADAAAARLTAWASDGVISPTEKQGIKDEIARIDADKANITAQYTKYGLGTPTAFNNASTDYRAVLVSLSASTPENIAIPSDFSSKQTYYYNERTSALGAIADASITSVNDVSEQLEQMQQEFAEVKEDVAGVKTSVDGLKNFTDEAFADGIVDRNESAAIASHINSIETFAKDAAESYTKVYENTLLTGTAKTNLANAYTAFTTAKTELVTTINGAIADGLVDALEKSAVDGKYTAFNTKYGDFVANLNAANRAIQDAINKNALQALQKIGELDYLKAALKEFTTIEGGLIQSSTLALGYTSDSGYQVMAGTNGIYDASKLGGGIASWWGGAMFDRFEYTEETMPEHVASALVRMDGTGYFAKGNLWWESDGTLHADPLSFFVGKETVGDVLGLFQFVKSDAGVEYVIPQHPFQKLEIGNYLQIGKAQLYWDEANHAFYVRHQDGVSPVGFYATGFISAKGANPNAGGAVSGASSLDDLSDVVLSNIQDGQVLAYDTATQKWVNKSVSAGWLDEEALAEYLTDNQYAKKGDISIAGLTDLHSSWDALLKAQKPTTLAGYGIADGVNAVNVTGSGNVVTSASVSGHVLTLTKGVNALTSVSLATISDLHSSWDAVLKAQKPAWLTTVSLATISDLHASWDALLKAAPSVYVTRWPAWSEVTSKPTWIGANKPSYAFSEITGKPTTLSGYGITDGVNAVSVTGSGNAVTTANVSGHTLTLTKGSTFALNTGANASGTWPISISGSAAQLGGLTWSNFRIKRIYSINLSSLPTTNFYPIFFSAAYMELDCEISSPNLVGAADYNNNRIHFLISSAGWSDNGHSFVILSRNNYSDSEITIGAIGYGQRNGGVAVWVRGGMSYTVIANQTPSLKTSNYTNGEEIYTVGTNIYGGTNTYVSLAWQNTTSTYSHSTVVTNNSNPYFSSSIKIGSGTISWDSTNNCFHFSHGLYSDSFVSAKGANSGSGGTVSGVTKLSDLSDVQLGTLATNQVLSWNGSKWVNKAISTGLDETALAQYLTNNQYLTMPTGDERYVKKAGDTMTGVLTANGGISITADKTLQWSRNTDYITMGFKNTSDGDADSYFYQTIGGNGNEYFKWQQAISGGSTTELMTLKSDALRFKGNVVLHAGNYTTYTVTKTGDGATGTWPIWITGNAATATKLALQDTRSVNTAPFANGRGLIYHFKYNTADGLNDGGTYHSVLQFNQWDESTGGLCKQLALTDGGNMWFRNASSATAWGAWKKLLDSSNYSSTLDTRYIKKAGDTMTGSLTLNTTGLNAGINIGGISITRQDDNTGLAILNTNGIIRFGDKNWDFNHWAGLRYVHSNKYLYLGIADGSIFKANSAKSGGSILTPGISNIFVGNNTTNKVWHAGNDGSGSGLDADLLEGYHGSSYLRSFWTKNPGYDANTYPTNSFCTFTYSRNAPYTGVLAYLGANGYGMYLNLAYITGTSTGQIAYRKVSPSNDGGGLGGWAYLARTTDNVYSATQLQTARTINGTAFNGTSNIVTNYWGTTRTLSLTGNATGSVSMNGSSNVSMSVNVNYATSAGNADTLDGRQGTSYAIAWGMSVNTDKEADDTTSTSITDFLTRLNYSGIFGNTFGAMRGSWYYVGNTQYNTGVGSLEMAGTAVLNMSGNANAGSTLKTLLFLEGPTGNMYSYVSQESGVARWSRYAKTTDNVYSATKLQTARTIWGRPFDGTAPVSGNMTEVGDISFNGSNRLYWKESGYGDQFAIVPYFSGINDSNILQFQSAVGATGTTPALTTKMVIAGSTGNVGIGTTSPSYKLHVAGTGYFSGALTTASTITASGNITGSNIISTTNHIYFGDSSYTNGRLTYDSNTLYIQTSSAGNMNLCGRNGATMPILTINATTTHCVGGIYSDSYVSAKGNNSSSDIRLKNILCPIHPSLEAFAKAPLFRFAWKSNPDMVEIGSSAQYWRNVLPDTVKERDGWLEMGYGNIALAGVITIACEVETLEQRVDRLEKENGKLKKRIKELERRTRE